jgi:hypothetical protein
MNGISANEKRFAPLTMKTDIGLKDSNCFQDLTYQLISVPNILTKVTVYYMSIHSSIQSDILSTPLIQSYFNTFVDTVDYYPFPFCSLPPSSPNLVDQSVYVNVDLKTSWKGDSFAIVPACINEKAVQWTAASQIDGSPLPGSLIFNPIS